MTTVDTNKILTAIAELTVLVKDNSTAIESLARMTSKRFDQVDERFDRLETRVDRLEIKVDRLDTRVGRLETQVDHLENPENAQDLLLTYHTDDIRILKTKFGI